MALTKISTGMLKADAASVDLNIDAGTLFLDVANNRVGVANTSPSVSLHVSGGAGSTILNDSTSWSYLRLKSPNANGGYIQFADADDDDVGQIFYYHGSGGDYMSFTTGAAERMRINSSGNVGIGTTNPQAALHAVGNILSSGTVQIFPSAAGAASVQMQRQGQGTAWSLAQGNTATDMFEILRGASSYFAVTSSGSVGIGTTSPPASAMLDIKETTAGADLLLGLTPGTGGRAQIRSVAQSDATSSVLSFHTMSGSSTSEKMRLDNGGNLLLGKTTTSVTTLGFEARDGGILAVNRNSATPVYFGRQTDYGHIIEFRKDTSIVGKLGIEASGFYIDGESAHSGLKFSSAGITPRLNQVGSNNTIDLGESGIRFKDLYLGGVAYAGTISSGDVEILDTSPLLTLKKSDETGRQSKLQHASGITKISSRNNASNGVIAFEGFTSSATQEYGRFDSSGTFLVGKTSSNISSDGVELGTRVDSTADGTYALRLNRRNSGGVIAQFRKDGSVVGEIGSNSSRFFIHNNYGSGAGIRFDNASLRPSTATGASEDATTDLGVSGARFKDLHLSGVAYVGAVVTTSSVRSFDGSASAASFNSINDINTGLFFPAANNLAVTTDGTERLRVDALGKVGIGTASPVSNLHIKTSVDNSVSQGLVIERSANSDRGYINYSGGGFQFRSTVGDPIVFGETDAEHVRIQPDGNVGIGTTSPSEKLEVNAGNIRINNATGGSYFKAVQTTNGANAGFFMASGSSNWYTLVDTAGRYQIYDGDAAAIRVLVDGSGKVGIGTTSPAQKLEVVSGGFAYVRTRSTASSFTGFDIGQHTGGAIYLNNRDNTSINFMTNNSQRMQLDNSGNLGIGTTSPGQKLDVVGTIQSSVGLRVAGHPVVGYSSITGGYAANLGSTGTSTLNETHIYSGGTQRVVINGSGNVGIGTTSPDKLLHIKTSTTSAITPVVKLQGNFSANDSTEGTSIDWVASGDATAVGSRIIGTRAASGANMDLRFHTGRDDFAMLIDRSGNVGIGTASPTGAKLHVAGGIKGTDLIAHDSTGINLQTDEGTKRLVVTDAGNIGIGTTNPGSKLTVEGDIRQTTGDLLYTGGGNYNIRHLVNDQNITFDTTTGGTTSERMRIDSAGRVTIGTTSNSNSALTVQGDGTSNTTFAFRADNSSGNHILEARDDGVVLIDTNYLYVTNSAGMYSQGAIRARGGITNDGSNPLSISSGASHINFNSKHLESVGNITSTGIYLGGTGSANHLDDYEEGNWNPILGASGGESGQSYNLQNGKYTKIGRFVHCTFDVQLSTLGTLSGTYVVLKGLPFTPNGSNLGGGLSVGYSTGFTTTTKHGIRGYLSGGNCYLMEGGEETHGSNYIQVSENKMGGSARLIGAVTIHVA